MECLFYCDKQRNDTLELERLKGERVVRERHRDVGDVALARVKVQNEQSSLESLVPSGLIVDVVIIPARSPSAE